MKKLLLLFLNITFLYNIGISQVKEEIIKLQKVEAIQKVCDYKENGFIIVTQNEFANFAARKRNFYCYNNDLEKIWDREIKTNTIDQGFDNPIIYHPQGDYLYFIEIQGISAALGPTKYTITQVSRKDGKTKNIDVTKLKSLGKIQSITADKNALYIIAIENQKKSNEKIVLYRFDEEMKMNKITVNKSAEKNIFWNFKTISPGGLLYFVNKNIDLKSNTVKSSVMVVDSEGSIKEEYNLNYIPQSGLVRPSYSWPQEDGTHIVNTRSAIVANIHAASFGDILFDFEKKYIYTFGLTGERKFVSYGVQPKYEAMYIRKFDMESKKLITSIDQGFSNEVMSDGGFKKAFEPLSRILTVIIEPNQDVRFHALSRNNVYTLEFDKNGKYQQAINCKCRFGELADLGEASICFTGAERLKSIDYLNNKASIKKNSEFYFLRRHNSEILILIKENINTLKICSF